MKEYTHASARLTVSGDPSEMTISYTSGQARDAIILLAITCVSIIAVILPSLYIGGPYLCAAFLLGLAVVFYRALAFTLERTTIRAVGERLTVKRHGPLPWFRGADLNLMSGEVGRFLYWKRPNARGAVGGALRDGRRVIFLSGVLRAGEAEAVITALRRWLEAAGGQEVFERDERHGGAPAAATHHSKRAVGLSAVAFASDPGGHTIVYKWYAERKWNILLVLFWLLLAEAPLTIGYLELSRFWVDFNLIDYPSFLIASLFLGYGTALMVFNKTTTRITDTTFSVRRGPVPCFWPGDYDGPVEDVRQVCCSCHDTPGGRTCYVYVIAGDGTRLNLSTVRDDGPESGGRQFNLFTVRDDDLAFEWGTRVRGWIDEKRRKRVGLSYSLDEQPRVLEREWSPPDRARRLKIMFSLVATFCGVAVLMAGAEYLAAFYRPARRARRHEEIYQQFLGRLLSQENYAFAVPANWRRDSAGFREPLDVVYRNQPISLYRGMNETFRDPPEGRPEIEIKGLDAAEVTGTPCGRGYYFVFPLRRAALTQDAAGTVSADTPTVKIASVYQRRVKDDAGGEWVCVREDPRLSGNSE